MGSPSATAEGLSCFTPEKTRPKAWSSQYRVAVATLCTNAEAGEYTAQAVVRVTEKAFAHANALSAARPRDGNTQNYLCSINSPAIGSNSAFSQKPAN